MAHDKDHPLDCTTNHTACTDCADFDASAGGHGLMSKADKIKLDGLGGGGLTDYIFLYRSDSLTLTNNNQWYDVPFNIAAGVKAIITHDHTSDPEEITLTEAGVYEISYTARFQGAPNTFAARLVDDGNEILGSWSVISVPNQYFMSCHNTCLVTVGAASVLKFQVVTDTGGRQLTSYNVNLGGGTAVCATISIKRIA